MSKIIDHIKNHDWLKDITINLFTRFYPFTNDEILLYKDILKLDDGYYLLSNENIQWSVDLIERINKKEIFRGLYKLNDIDFDIHFFKKNLKKFRKGSVNSLVNIQWNEELIELLDKKIDWKESYILRKISPEFRLHILRTRTKKLNWNWLSRHLDINFTPEIINEFHDLWDWSQLSSNTHLNIDINFLKTYKDKIDWKKISSNKAAIKMITEYPNSKSWDWYEVIINPGIKYDALNYETILKYYTLYHRNRTNNNPFYNKNPLSSFIFRIFQHQKNDISFFLRNEMFIKYIPFEYLTKNGNLTFTFDFINNNKDKLNFHDGSFIKKHVDIITEEFIFENFELFDSKSHYFYYLSISSRIVEKYKEQINFFYLAGCESFDWTLDFIIENDELSFYSLSTNFSVYNLISSKIKFSEIIDI